LIQFTSFIFIKIFLIIFNDKYIIQNYKTERSIREGFVNQGGTRSTLRQNPTISKVRQKSNINHKKNNEAHHPKTRIPHRHHDERKNTRQKGERQRSIRGRTKQLESL
jgi:hypothetical protein